MSPAIIAHNHRSVDLALLCDAEYQLLNHDVRFSWNDKLLQLKKTPGNICFLFRFLGHSPTNQSSCNSAPPALMYKRKVIESELLYPGFTVFTQVRLSEICVADLPHSTILIPSQYYGKLCALISFSFPNSFTTFAASFRLPIGK